MSKKIILYLSKWNQKLPVDPDTQEEKPEGYTYEAILGTETVRLTGAQTDEAPVEYFLKKYDDVDGILCLVTPEAEQTALKRFSEKVTRCAPGQNVPIHTIPVSGSTFSDDVVGKILQYVQTGTDEILLDTTGGFRNDVMHLLLISRVLKYRGNRIREAVYGDFSYNRPVNRIVPISDTIALFDLIGGMQEMTSTGSAGSLLQYCEQNRGTVDQKLYDLAVSMDELFDAISLCRVSDVEKGLEKFNSAMQEAQTSNDPLILAMLPVFRAKFGSGNDLLDTPDLIRWCATNGLIQQALTLYREIVPVYMFKKGIVCWDPEKAPVIDRKTDQQETAQLLQGLLFIPCEEEKQLLSAPELNAPGLFDAVRQALLKLNKVYASYYVNGKKQAGLVPANSPYHFMQYLPKKAETPMDFRAHVMKNSNAEDREYLLNAGPKESWKILLPKNKYERYRYALSRIKEDPNVFFEDGYSVRVRPETAVTLIKDYLYIREIRNMINHAIEGDKFGEDGNAWEILFAENSRYIPFESINASQTQEIVLKAVDVLEKSVNDVQA